MGKQKGALKLRGTHGDFNFAHTADGFIWREKAKFDKAKFLKNPQIIANIAEFARAGKAVRLFRSAFETQITKAKDRRLTPRLQKQMVKVLRSDTTHKRGDRLITSGDPVHLDQFQCNANALFGSTLGAAYDVTIDRATGEVMFNVPSFIPLECMKKPDLATHFTIVTAASELDFDGNTFNTAAASTGLMPIDDLASAPVALSCMLTPGTGLPVYVVAGLKFTQVENGFTYPLKGDEYNSMCIVKIDHP